MKTFINNNDTQTVKSVFTSLVKGIVAVEMMVSENSGAIIRAIYALLALTPFLVVKIASLGQAGFVGAIFVSIFSAILLKKLSSKYASGGIGVIAVAAIIFDFAIAFVFGSSMR